MGTYDMRGGSPISPEVPEPSISPLEEEVLSVLEDLDAVRQRAKAVLEEVFLRLVQHRYPVGTVVEISRLSWLEGNARLATKVKVRRHLTPEVSMEKPEGTWVHMECVTLRADESETKNLVRLSEPVLGRDYVRNRSCRRLKSVHALPARDRLLELVHEIENCGTDENQLVP